MSTEIIPLIKSRSNAETQNIETILNRLNAKRILIPNYQRDTDQWDSRKKSLFLESILNNLTIPAFFFHENESAIYEVVDGQQRLSTLLQFFKDEIKIEDDDNIPYLVPESALYRGKTYSSLAGQLKNIFNDYPLTVIYLPRGIDLTTKLEIFRRINEGGTPLSGQDIRLSYYSASSSVYFVRLVGIYRNANSTSEMIRNATEKGVENPWNSKPESFDSWCRWWEGKELAKGQRPSEMFLWYLILRCRDMIDNMLKNTSHLNMIYRGSTDEVLDIVCAQFRYSDENPGKLSFPVYSGELKTYFDDFERITIFILDVKGSGVSVDKYKQLAFVVGSLAEIGIELDQISEDQWDNLREFIRTPRNAGQRFLSVQGGYPEPKGRWGGAKGQKSQCDSAVNLVKQVLNM
ncbi:MAG: DUF262 domain-containing protein [Magnetococcales bacterium]|nr:DUF262 domain-containing protein [Magnetococcales bacterium]